MEDGLGSLLLMPHRANFLDPVTRSWVILVSGSVVRMTLGFLASVLIARALGPAEFGVYVLLGAVSNIASALADFGLSDAAVKRVAEAWARDPHTAPERGQAFFWTRIGVTGLVVAVGILLSGPLSERIFSLSQRHSAVAAPCLLSLAFLGVAATALSGAMSALLQATGRFGRVSVVMLTNAGLTALLAVILALAGRLTLISALVVLGIGTSVASFLTGLYLLPREWRPSLQDRNTLQVEGRYLLGFGCWLGLANMFAVLTAYLDVFLVNRWSAAATVGAYGLALNLASKVDVVNNSLYMVLLPVASALDQTKHIFGAYVRRCLLHSVGVSFALLPLILLARPFILFFYGPAYTPAIGFFQGLLSVVIFDVFTLPLLLLAYPLNQPKLLTVGDALRVLTLAIIATWLTPIYGPSGAVLGKFAAKAVGAVLTLAVIFRILCRASPGQAQRSDPSG